jgi:diguanylate cyclase (GGDEF)-like protein/PAS domain S-box-containing protein
MRVQRRDARRPFATSANRVRRAGALGSVAKDAPDGQYPADEGPNAGVRSKPPTPPVEASPLPPIVALAPLVAAVAAGAVGISAIVGWLAHVPGLLSWGATPTIKLNSALVLVAAAGATVLLRHPTVRRRRVALFYCLVVGCWAALTLLESVLGRSLGIDQALVHDAATAGVPGRASPHTAIALGLFAATLMTLDGGTQRVRRLHRLLEAGFLAAVVLAALGWLYGAPALTGHSRVTGVSLPTLTALVALLVGLLFLRPAAPPFALVRGSTPAATMMRRLIPAALLVPPLLGVLRLVGTQAGWYDQRFGLALFATSMVVVFIALILATARTVEKGDEGRRSGERTLAASEARFRALARLAPLGIFESDSSGSCTYVNPTWCEQTGLAARDARGQGWLAAVHPDDRDEVLRAASTAPAQDGAMNLRYRIRRPDGSERFIREHRATLCDQDGARTGDIRMTTDVTELLRAERAAGDVQTRMQAILDHLPIGIYLRSLDERYELVNAHFAREFGLRADQIVGRRASELHPAGLVELARQMEQPVYERGESVSSESAAPHADGTDHYHWILKYPVSDETGTLVAIGGAVVDITERRRAELALAEAEAEQAALRRVATAVAEGVGSATVFDLVAEEVARLLGLEVGVVVRFDAPEVATVIGAWSADSTIAVARIVKLDGTNAPSLVARTGHVAHIDRDESATTLGGAAQAGVAAPISIAGKLWGAVGAARTGDGALPANAEERTARFADLAAIAISNAQAQEMLASLASTDELTRLPNYRSFHDRLRSEVERATRHGRELSLAVFDVDAFKAINDQHGHGVGDAVLTEVARRLAAHRRDTDTVARVGGEEFAWLLPETDAPSALAVAERARLAIDSDPFDVVGTVTISAGVCSLQEAGDAESLLRLADIALYRAKDSGRNATCRYTSGAALAGPVR